MMAALRQQFPYMNEEQLTVLYRHYGDELYTFTTEREVVAKLTRAYALDELRTRVGSGVDFEDYDLLVATMKPAKFYALGYDELEHVLSEARAMRFRRDMFVTKIK